MVGHAGQLDDAVDNTVIVGVEVQEASARVERSIDVLQQHQWCHSERMSGHPQR